MYLYVYIDPWTHIGNLGVGYLLIFQDPGLPYLAKARKKL